MPKIINNPRELILNEAKKILYNEGFSEISIRKVAKESKIASGTIYNYFPSKKELIIEMMTDFWKEYFYNIEIILNSTEDMYGKLRTIFDKLAQFIKTFREVWLNTDIYSSPDYIKSGLERENVYIEKLIVTIEDLIKAEYKDYNKINTKKMASFIVMNFISIVQMPYYDYSFFENIIKKLF